MKNWAQIVLRIGLGLVVIYFGSQQLMDPVSWVSYLPSWTASLPFGQTSFIYLNGWFELVFGILLIAGFYTRIVSGLLALHLASIVFTIGYNEIGVRDFGLTVALASIALYGPSAWSLDEFFARKN